MTKTPAQQRADEIYREVLRRAPENDLAPDLDRMRSIADLIGDPQHAQPIIHLTGTNGKTSTSRMIEALLREMNLRTGRYSSPHLTDVRERIAIDGESISPENFAAVWDDLQPYIAMVDEQSESAGGPKMTFFEVLTAMAYAAFADAPVEVGIVEVGMGGSWDATNIADGGVAVITTISRDHQHWLGQSLEEIAAEKAGIMKQGRTVVMAKQRDGVAQILLDAAAEKDVRVLREDVDLAVLDRQAAVGGQLLTLQTSGGIYEGIFLPLLGEHQAHNALLALAAVEQFIGSGGALPADVVEKGFAEVKSPGRLEVVRSSPAIIVDAAHNAAGAKAVGEALEEVFGFDRLVAVIGMLDDKDAEAFLSELEPVVTDVVITAPASPRAMSIEDLTNIARDIFDEDQVHPVERLDDAVDKAATLAEDHDGPLGGGVIITGSIVLVAHARILLGRAEG